ncbi:MAG: hypothetical protein ACREFP_02375 [Acetobacteraceae bacterium]
MRPALLTVAMMLTAACAARADFVLLPGAKLTRPAALVSRPGPGPAQLHLPLPPLPPPVMSGEIAAGFGDHVPLSFACRQIVPQGIDVIFGPGAHPDTRVSWKGGETWAEVLRDAVRPLGLRLVLTRTTVEIRG